MPLARPQLWAPSETAPPEREVQLRVKDLYDKVDTSGRLHYEGKFITHAYARQYLDA